MKTKYSVSAAAVALLAVGVAWAAETLPLKSVNKAGEVIDAALAAHGGAEAIAKLNSLVQENEFITFASGQSRAPGPPWDQGRQETFNAVDFEHEIFVNRNTGEGGGYYFDGGTIINGEHSWQLDFRGATAAPLAEPDFNTQSGPMIRVTPALLMKQLQDRRQTSHWLGEVDVDGRPHDVITLVMEVGPGLSLYFDKETHMLTRSERVLPPFGQVEYRFEDYETIDGIPFNRKFKLFVNGQDNLIIDVKSIKVNAPVEQYTQVPAGLREIGAVVLDDLNMNEIDEGVFMIGGTGTYALFVEMNDHVVAIGGTQGIPDRIKELRRAIPDKPIRYGVLTHHHSDHVPGAAAYAAEGATIIALKQHEEVVRNAAGNENAKLELVSDRMTLTDGDRTIELYDIGPTPHAEHILIAWLPDEKIIFEADHFPQPRTGPVPPAVPATMAFAKAIEARNLDWNMIVGAHSPRIGRPADMEAALSRQSASDVGSH